MKTFQNSLVVLVSLLVVTTMGVPDGEPVTLADAAPVANGVAGVLNAAKDQVNALPQVPAQPVPVPGTFPTLEHPKGEAVTTQTRTPDGSVITVTKFNGQIPHSMFQPHFPGFWAPFQYGMHQPIYNYPM